MNLNEFDSVVNINPPMPEPVDATEKFASMLKAAGIKVIVIDSPSFSVQTIKRGERYKVDIASFKAQDLDHLVSEVVKFNPDVVYLREVKDFTEINGKPAFTVRFNFIKVEV